MEVFRADIYKNVRDTIPEIIQAPLENRTGGNMRLTIGQRVIMGPSFTKGPHRYDAKFYNGIVICFKYKKPDFFVTLTCNQNWMDIMDELKPGNMSWIPPNWCSVSLR